MLTILPTKNELETLQEEKGKDTLIWYAWRNSLRALPFLGNTPLQSIWKENTVKHIFSVFRVPLALANLSTKPMTSGVAASIAENAKIANAIAGDIYMYTNAAASTAVVNAESKAAHNDFRAYADLDQARNAHFNATSLIVNNAAVTASSSTTVYSKAAEAAKADYDFLKMTSTFRSGDWFSQPLWHSHGLSSSEHDQFNYSLQQFLKKLHNIGLKFLADDLNRLYQSKENPIQPHWLKYLEKPSEVVFESAESLYRFVFEEIDQFAVRALLLGPGGAGKTSLSDRLQGKMEEKQHSATIGIDYLNQNALPLNDPERAFVGLEIPKNLKLFLWDFGGQTLFQGLHQAFLHENCVYILVVDSRHEQEPDEWLNQILHLTNSVELPPVLIVVNEYENCQNIQNKTRLQQLFKSKIQFFYLRCNDPKDERLNSFKQGFSVHDKKISMLLTPYWLLHLEELDTAK